MCSWIVKVSLYFPTDTRRCVNSTYRKYKDHGSYFPPTLVDVGLANVYNAPGELITQSEFYKNKRIFR